MKKLMTTLAASLVATAIMADVTSQNVVGYSSLTFKQGYNLVGVQFEAVGGGTIDIQDIFTDITLMGYDEDAVPYDFMNVWGNLAGGYVGTFYWTGDFDDEADGEEIPPNVWVDASDEVVENYSIAPNAGFWIYHYGTGATLTFSSPL